MNWLEVIPAFLSAIAAIAAAIAAFQSVQIGKRSAEIAKETALATNHSSAALAYTEALKTLREAYPFFEVAYDTTSYWAQDIEHQYAIPNTGGTNPRPLRHVLYDGSGTLAHYGIKRGEHSRIISQEILSVISNGMGIFNDAEYEKLLKKADGDPFGPDSIFGSPSPSAELKESPSFKWTCYQLLKRVTAPDWKSIWEEAWQNDGRIKIYQDEYLKVKPTFEKVYNTLKNERDKLAHGLFPIDHNPDLAQKYEKILFILNVLIEDCSLGVLKTYRKWEFDDENSHLILIAMAIARLTMIKISALQKLER